MKSLNTVCLLSSKVKTIVNVLSTMSSITSRNPEVNILIYINLFSSAAVFSSFALRHQGSLHFLFLRGILILSTMFMSSAPYSMTAIKDQLSESIKKQVEKLRLQDAEHSNMVATLEPINKGRAPNYADNLAGLKRKVDAAFLQVNEFPTMDSFKNFCRHRKNFYDFEGLYGIIKEVKVDTSVVLVAPATSKEEFPGISNGFSMKTEDLQQAVLLKDYLSVVFKLSTGTNNFEKFDFLSKFDSVYKRPLFEETRDSDFVQNQVYLFYLCKNMEFEQIKELGALSYRQNPKEGDQFVAIDLHLDPMSALVSAFYFTAKGYMTGNSTEYNLICFRPRALDGIQVALSKGEASYHDDGSMRSIRYHSPYTFSQVELHSMLIFKIRDLPIETIKDRYQDSSEHLRLFGRYYDPFYGISIENLLNISNFSTYQSLKINELNFLDEVSDDDCIYLSDKIKRHISTQGMINDESIWPPAFLMRIKKIYELKGLTFSIEI